MSTLWRPPYYGPKGRERDWLNSIHQIHSIFCGCSNTVRHLLFLLSTEITEKEDFEAAQKCLTTMAGTDTEPTTHGENTENQEETDMLDLIEDGELAQLFADAEDDEG